MGAASFHLPTNTSSDTILLLQEEVVASMDRTRALVKKLSAEGTEGAEGQQGQQAAATGKYKGSSGAFTRGGSSSSIARMNAERDKLTRLGMELNRLMRKYAEYEEEEEDLRHTQQAHANTRSKTMC
jgi:hypothetical protein